MATTNEQIEKIMRWIKENKEDKEEYNIFEEAKKQMKGGQKNG